MSATTVDSRVVQFSFDNSKFESNVKTSLSTIEKLKDSLNFDDALKGFDDIDKASKGVSMSGLGEALDTMHAKFSALQVMGVTALANITNSVVNLGKKILSNIVGPITQGGWNRALNIENAKFQLEGLDVAWSEIEDDINHGVRDTAYGLDSAAKVAAQLVASQVQLGDDMKAALRGISGVASMTNSTYDDIGRIFTTVAGNGRLMGDQLLQLSTRGLNAASVLGEALGHTEAEIRQMVSKGQIDFNTFAKAMDDAFGKHAKDANNTFTGAMSNVKAALARIGANFATPIMKAGTDVFNAIRVTVNKINAALQPVYDMASEGIEKVRKFLVDMFESSTPIERFQNKVKDIGITWDDFQKKVVATANKDVFGFEQLDSRVENFEDGIKRGLITSETFVEVLNSMIGPMKEGQTAIESVTVSYSEFHDIVQKVIRGDFGTGAQRMQALANAGYDAALIQNLVNQELEGSALTLETINEETLANVGYTEEQIAKLIELRDAVQDGTISIEEMIEAMNRPTKIQLGVKIFTNLLTAAKVIIDSVRNAWSRAFGKKKNADGFYNLLAALEKFTSKLILTEEKAEKLTKTFEGFFAVLDLIGTIVETVFNEAFRVLAAVLGDVHVGVLDTTSSIGELLVGFRDWADESQAIQIGVGKLADGIIKMVDTIKDWIKSFKELPFVKEVIDSINDRSEKLVETLKDWFSTNTDLNAVVAKFKTSLENVADKVKEWFDAFKNLPIIKDSIESLKTISEKVLTKIKDLFGQASEKVKEFFSKLDADSLDKIKEKFKNFGKAIADAFKDPKTTIDNLLESFSNFKNKAKEFLDGINFDFDAFKEKIVDTFKSLGTFFKDNAGGLALGAFGAGLLAGSYYIYEGLLTLSSLNPIKPLSTLAVALNNYARAERIKAWAVGIDIFAGAVLKLVGAVAALSLIDDLDHTVEQFEHLLVAFGGVVTVLMSISAMASGFSGISFTAGADKSLSGTVNGVVIAMAGIAASLWILSSAFKNLSGADLEGMTEKINLMVAFLIALTMSGGVLQIVGHAFPGDPSSIALPIIALAAAVWVLVDALKKIGELPIETIELGISTIIKIVATLSGGTLIASLGKGGAGTALTIVAFAVSLELIYNTMRKFAKMKYSEINKGIDAIDGILLRLGAVMISTAFAGKYAQRGGIAILAISLALILIAEAFKKFGSMDPAMFEQAEKALTPIVAVIAILLAVSRLAGAFSMEAGVMILAISAAIVILSGAAWVLSKLEPDKMTQGVAAISVFLGLITILVAVSKNARGIKMGPIIALTVLLGVLAAALVLMEKLNVQNALTNAIALGILFGVIVLAFGAMSLAKDGIDKSALASLVALVAILGLVAVVIGIMDTFNVESSISNAISLGALLLALSAAMFILSKSEFKQGQINDALKGMVALTLVMGALATMLGIMQAAGIEANITNVLSLIALLESLAVAMFILSNSEFDEGQMETAVVGMGLLSLVMVGLGLVLAEIQALQVQASLTNVLALTVLLEAMAVAMLLLSHAEFKDPASLGMALGGMLGLAAVLLALGDVLAIISGWDISVSWQTVLQLSELLIAMSAAMILLEVAGLGGAAAIIGVGSLVALIVALGGLFLGIGALMESFPQLEDFVDKGIPVVVKIAGGIGEIFGALVGGVIDRISESLPGLGASLSLFGMSLNPFIIAVKGINDQVIGGVKNLAEIVLILAASDLISGIASLLGSDKTTLSDFGKELVKFAPYVHRFGVLVSDIDEDTVSSAANAALVLATVVEKLPYEGGVIGEIFGEKNFEGFGEGIGAFGEGIMKFQEAVKDGVDEELVTSAANAGGTLAELESKLKNHGGWLQTILGDSDLSTFGGTLENFGKGIIAFQQSLTEPIDSQLIEDAATAGGAIAELESSLKDHSGWWQKIFGDSDLTTFGKQLPGFGDAITKFQQSLPEEIKADLIDQAANAAGTLAALEAGLNNHDGIWQMFTGDQDIGTFGENLKTFGSSFKEFHDSITQINTWDWVSFLVTALVDLIDTDQYITEQANNGATYGENITDLATHLDTFGGAFSSYYDKIKGMFTNKLSNATGELVKLINAFKDAKNADGISSFATSLGEIATEGLDLFVSTFEAGASNEAISAANSFMDGFNNALQSDANISNMATAINNIVDLFVTTISGAEETLTGLGMGVTGSIANGIYLSETVVTGAISNLMDTISSNFDTTHSVNASAMGEKYVSSMAGGIKKKYSDVTSTFSALMKSVMEILSRNVAEFEAIGETIASSFSGPISGVLGTANTTVGDFYSQFYTIGRDLCDGLIAGIQSKESQVARAARFVGMTLISELRKVLDEHSPSREAIEIGEYFDRGLAEGLDNGNSLVSRTITTVGDGIITGFSSVMSKVAKALDAGIEINPTITPVLDLGEIQNGVDSMNYMLGNGNYSINGAVDFATMAQQGFNAQLDENNQITMAILDLKKTMEAMQVPSNVYNNTFNISGNDPDTIADEISGIFQHDIERGDAVWA